MIQKENIRLFLASFLVLCFFSIAFYPGLASYDSKAAVDMASGLIEFNPGMTYFYVGLIKISLILFKSTGFIIIIQSLVMSLSLMYVFSKLQVSNKTKIISIIVITTLPGIWVLTSGLWKDSLFVSGFLFLLGILLDIDFHKRVRKNIVVLALGMMLVGFFRPNGFLIIGIFIILLFLKLKKVNKTIIFSIVFLSLTYFINVQVPSLLKQPMWHIKTNIWSQFVADVAESWAIGSVSLDEENETFMLSLTSKSEIKNIYQCEMVNTLYGITKMELIPDNSLIIRDIWLEVLRNDPGRVFHSRICRGSMLFKPFPRINVDSNGFYEVPYPIFLGQWAEAELGPQGRVNSITEFGRTLLTFAWSPYLLTPLWWGGFWFWIVSILFYFKKYIIKNKIAEEIKLCYFFLTLYTLAIGFTVPAVDFRFALPQLLTSLIIFINFTFEKKNE
jgi:hypothetical protein